MRFFITKKTSVWVILALCAILIGIALSGCGEQRGADHRDPKDKPPVQDVLEQVSVWTAWIGGLAIPLGIVGFIFLPTQRWLIIKGLFAAIGLIVGANVVAYIALHSGALTAIGIGALVVAAIVFGWKNLGKIERWMKRDLDGNGKIGDAITRKMSNPHQLCDH